MHRVMSVRKRYTTGLEPTDTPYTLLCHVYLMRIVCSWICDLSACPHVWPCVSVYFMWSFPSACVCVCVCGVCVCVWCVCVCVSVSVLRSLPSVRRDPESPLQSSSDEKPQTPSKHPKHPIMPITPHAWAPALRTHHRPSTSSSSTTTDVCQRPHFLSKIVWGEHSLPYNY